MTRTIVLMQWPLDLAIPRGWRRAACRPSHHDRWSVLLIKVTR